MDNVSSMEIANDLTHTEFSSSRYWSWGLLESTRMPINLSRIGPTVGLVFALAGSPATAIQDVWASERRKRDALTTHRIIQEIVGVPISRSEALTIARQIMETAEKERLAIADFEAVRGIDWDNGE